MRPFRRYSITSNAGNLRSDQSPAKRLFISCWSLSCTSYPPLKVRLWNPQDTSQLSLMVSKRCSVLSPCSPCLLTKTISNPVHPRRGYPLLNSLAITRHIGDGPQAYNCEGQTHLHQGHHPLFGPPKRKTSNNCAIFATHQTWNWYAW